MTDAESGPAPTTDGPTLPDGWAVAEAGFAYVVPDSPLLPQGRINREDPGAAKKLDADESFTRMLKWFAGEIAPERAMFPDAPAYDDPDSPRHEEWVAWLQSVSERLGHFCALYGPRSVRAEVRFRHAVERLFPGWELVGRMNAVVVVANIQLETMAFPLEPGELAMLFRGASQTERNAYSDLIEAMQVTLRHARNYGGRNPREADDEKRTEATVAAKLHHWLGFSQEEVASFFGWTGNDKAVRERVRRAWRAGEQVLDDEHGGDHWRSRPPTAIAALTERFGMG